ncbi:leucine-rich repeat and calponin homology domain-containing protein [Condylostylus longicornis]|uniref:leucine-rich repeat and calponin homology domain-containing protein n=1 Tax=Condylostylus longicornis TaxID=2530218 RepID=UPI00244E0C71|nr:leucine-rich repeat and calponin homology domain-containing protein [Condylostylus longicornis]
MYKIPNNTKNGQCLVRPLERILEEAHLSGELKLNNRKLKDFPKLVTAKYSLSDTVIADLSRNKFCEWPEELTHFAFLETLLLYHNSIRSIPASVSGLFSLTYLDLRSNQLVSLPREICFLPLQVLLISNNKLTNLPEELGRMEKLTDLDASCNQIMNLPLRIGDLRSLKSLSLRSNNLSYFPREITLLTLVSLDVSNNKISSLPLEVRHMNTLVEFYLENNPLTFPPANLCIRGLIHVFKYLDTQANKNEKGNKSSNSNNIHHEFATMKRTGRQNASTNNMIDIQLDALYSPKNGLHNTIEKSGISYRRNNSGESFNQYSTTPRKTSLTQDSFQFISDSNSVSDLIDKSNQLIENLNLNYSTKTNNSSNSNSSSTLHDDDLNFDNSNEDSLKQNDSIRSSTPKISNTNNVAILNNVTAANNEKNKKLENIQTYREYVEAKKQQRNQENSNVYKSKLKKSNSSGTPNNVDGNQKFNNSEIPSNQYNNITSHLQNGSHKKLEIYKKPTQKVSPQNVHNNDNISIDDKTQEQILKDYLKPKSPIKPMVDNREIVGKNTSFNNSNNSTITSNISNSATFSTKMRRNVTWNEAIPTDKLSFTMRREFDKHKEETELLSKLRNIIETKLKMSLPEDISTALMDGVILCHLANIVRPRSVASIHVPSPGVPHLTMARCRRNVDNFLEACRRIGVDENLICCAADVLEGKQLVQVAITVGELFRLNGGNNIEKGDHLKSPIKVSSNIKLNNSTPNT